MRVALCYPPIPSPKGTPLLSQNRQFQWFGRHAVIFPVVPAQAATQLSRAGHDVLWADGIARSQDPDAYIKEVAAWRPDLLFLETKTPVVRFHLAWLHKVRALLPDCRLVLGGDHAAALPDECRAAAPEGTVILTHGDYDRALLALVGEDTSAWDLRAVPPIDRALTRWRDYAYRNGNFSRRPGAYVMAGRDCWYGKCSFCSWTGLYPRFRVRPPEALLDEIGALIDLGAREIMDDTGSFPTGPWLRAFCQGMIARGYSRRVRIDCNQRFGALSEEDFRLMRRAGFRLILFGAESANQSTLDRLNKGISVDRILTDTRAAARAGLDVHVTLMFGYPWEDLPAARRTADLGRTLLRRGCAATLQATWLVPYPGTPLFKDLDRSGLLLTRDWDRYDMRAPVMRSPLTETDIRRLITYTYRGFLQPPVLLRRLLRILLHPLRELPPALRGLLAILGHLRDFRPQT